MRFHLGEGIILSMLTRMIEVRKVLKLGLMPGEAVPAEDQRSSASDNLIRCGY
jgi:hypothetical protein